MFPGISAHTVRRKTHLNQRSSLPISISTGEEYLSMMKMSPSSHLTSFVNIGKNEIRQITAQAREVCDFTVQTCKTALILSIANELIEPANKFL
jgi:hypothetical protein